MIRSRSVHGDQVERADEIYCSSVSGPDAVDGSSTGTKVPSMWVLLGRL